MICTVTLNPAYDKTVEVRDLVPHEVNVILSVRFDPGGKGINVSRVVQELGLPTVALGIIGGDTGLFINNYLEKRGIITRFVHVDQPTRTNLTVIDIGDPPATELNEPGPTIDEKVLLDVEKSILESLPDSKFFVFAGSLPKGCPDDTYCRLIDLVRRRGATAVLDTRDAALHEGVKAKPFMIKPNQFEAAALLGRKIETIEETAAACNDFLKQGIKVAIISLGARGAVMASEEGIFRGISPQVKVEGAAGAVGAGDSLVAGVCAGILRGQPTSEAFRLGMACGTATATAPGTSLCKKEMVESFLPQIQIEKMGVPAVKA
jgi:1-phosphofructokinase